MLSSHHNALVSVYINTTLLCFQVDSLRMSKRKVQFQDAEDEKRSSSRRFKEKHSLDSDEEDEETDDRMNEDDIEGN